MFAKTPQFCGNHHAKYGLGFENLARLIIKVTLISIRINLAIPLMKNMDTYVHSCVSLSEMSKYAYHDLQL